MPYGEVKLAAPPENRAQNEEIPSSYFSAPSGAISQLANLTLFPERTHHDQLDPLIVNMVHLQASPYRLLYSMDVWRAIQQGSQNWPSWQPNDVALSQDDHMCKTLQLSLPGPRGT